jgi:uncharacterized membrane-anchored protein
LIFIIKKYKHGAFMNFTKNAKLIVKKMTPVVAVLTLGLMCTESFAAISNGSTIGTIANNLNTSLSGVVNLVQGVAYTAGFVLGITALFQFKAHKDNPQQTPLSKPIVSIFLSALMLYLPTFIDSGAQSVWGAGANATQATRPGGLTGGLIPGL